MGRTHKPRSGSVAYMPRKRAKKETPRIHSWPAQESEEVRPLSFSCYKAGMTHVMALDNTENALTKGLEVMIPVTVVEAHPMRVAAVRVYGNGYFGRESKTDLWSEITPELERRLKKPKKAKKPDFQKLKKDAEKISDVRLIVQTQPGKTDMPKKIPDLMEIALSGTPEKKLDYAEGVLGKELNFTDVFQPNQYVDVTAVTKGKGFQGIVKRWGVKKQPRKSSKRRRHMGTGGAWTPTRKLWTEPQAGQMGYHTRTEFNKVIMDVGSEGEKITPKGGFLRYGNISGEYVVLKGSLPGSTKRLVRLTPARRPPKKELNYEIMEVNLDSKQG
ncbi:50S ribosomal protein L3 [Candidatus Altiarchaeota archaeon]